MVRQPSHFSAGPSPEITYGTMLIKVGVKSGTGDWARLPLPRKRERKEGLQCSLRLEEIRDLEQHELVVVGLVGVAADENGRLLSLPTMMWLSSTRSNVLDSEEREGVDAVIQRLSCLLVGGP